MSHHQQILVTGGAGFIGSHLVERLLREGYSVKILDDLSTGSLSNLSTVKSEPGLRFFQSKVSECKDLPRLVGESSYVVHLAAAVGVDLVVSSPIETIHNNVWETEVLMETASRYGTPVLLASTSEVYGKSVKAEFTETDDLLIGPPYLGRWGYACSKLVDEFVAFAYAHEKKLPIIIARFFNTVGPRQTGRYGMVLPRFIAAARENQPLRVYGDGSQSRCFCFVLDTVEALMRLMRRPEAFGEVFNIGSTEEVTIQSLAERVIKALDSRSEIVNVPYDQAYAPGFEDMLRRKPSVEKLYQTIQYRPRTSLQEIIEKTAKGMAKDE